jgi:outer membrane protein assembly factor BamB
MLPLLAGAAAGCGAARRSDVSVRPHKQGPRASLVRVVVFDGDLRRRVPSATVWVGHRRLLADRRGVARVRLVPGPAIVRVRARGYAPTERRWNFRRFPIFTVRVYQPRLQWTMYGGDPERTQVHRGIRLRPPFRIIWSVANQNLIEFSAVVSDGFAYIATQLGTVRAISMRYGTIAWRRELHATMAASLAIWGDQLVVHDMNGHVRVLDRRNGRTRWDRYIGSPIESSPVIHNDVDYFGTWDGRVIAIDLRRRRVRWSDSFGAKITASVSLAGNTAYLGNYGGRVLALDARTGRLRWSGSVNGRVYGTAPISSGRLFVPSSDGDSVTAFSTTGARLWSVGTGSYVYSSPAAWAGRVIFGSYNGMLYCVSAASGRRLWTVAVGGSISGAPIVVSGVVYAASFGNRTVGVNVRTGRVIFRFPHGEYVPVSGNGGRLLLHGYSRVWAVEPRRR